MNNFTITRYNGIGERPIVVLINNPIEKGLTVNTLLELKSELNRINEKVYFVEHNDIRFDTFPYSIEKLIVDIDNHLRKN